MEAGRQSVDSYEGLPDHPPMGAPSEWLQTMLNHIPDYICAKDHLGRFLMANSVTVEDNGFTDISELIGKTDFDLHDHAFASRITEIENRVMATGEAVLGIEEKAWVTKGHERWLMTSKVPLRNKQGLIIGTVGVSRDISDRKRSEKIILAQTQLLEMIVASAPLENVFTDLIALIEGGLEGVHASIMLVDPAGSTLQVAAGPTIDPAYLALVDNMLIGPSAGSCGTAAFRGKPVNVADIRCDPLWADARGLTTIIDYRACWSIPIMSYEGRVLGTFAVYGKVIGLPTAEQEEFILLASHLAGIAIERKRSEERIKYLAHHDALTGLPNRVQMEENIERSLHDARLSGDGLVIAFLDLDNFKLVNDTLGHTIGDAVLRETAARMLAHMGPKDRIVRVGGDEFIVMLTVQRNDQAGSLQRLEAIRASIAVPLPVAGRTLHVTCSVGVACFPQHGENTGELMAHADAAMYRAKELGRNVLQVFDIDIATEAQLRLRQHADLRDAVAGHQFELHYQPQLDLATGRIFAVESLLRWHHPVQGLVSPCNFIPLAEETGLIVPIGAWVLQEACRQNKAWQDAGLPPLVVCVNVSARQFREADWVATVSAALEETGLAPEYLELELTESLIMQDVPKAIATMHELEALGVQLAIDDFGTGYSSLSALKRFPVRRLKIDRTFVQDLPDDEEDMAITAAIISLGQKLQMKVIAEGVETQAQIDCLRACGCDEIQGYVLSRPVPADDLASLIRRGSDGFAFGAPDLQARSSSG